jgi:hypothetical protein
MRRAEWGREKGRLWNVEGWRVSGA